MKLSFRQTKTLVMLSLGFFIVLQYQACGPTMKAEDFNAVDSKGLSTASGANLERDSLKILADSCVRCHNASNPGGGYGDLQNLNNMVSQGLIIRGDATNSLLYMSLLGTQASPMPPGSKLANSEVATISAWIISLKVPTSTTSTTLAPVTLPPTETTLRFATHIQPILNARCVSCHRTGNAQGGFTYESYNSTMRSVVARNPNSSLLYTEIQSGAMPTGSTKCSTSEIELIRAWITQGASI